MSLGMATLMKPEKNLCSYFSWEGVLGATYLEVSSYHYSSL